MRCVSAAAQLSAIGLIWLASHSSAEAAAIVALFSEHDPACGQPIAWIDLTPAGIGTISPPRQINPIPTAACEEIDSDRDEIAAPSGGGVGGAFGGGFGGLLGAGSGARSTGSAAMGAGTLARDGEIVIGTPKVFDPPQSLTGDVPPGGGQPVRNAPSIDGPAGGGDVIDVTGGNSLVMLGASMMTDPLFPGWTSGGIPSGHPGGLQDLNDPSLAVVPEPGTVLLFGTGLIIAARHLRRRIRSKD